MDRDEQELEAELYKGRLACEMVVKHVETMGASSCTIPTQGSDCSVWEITVKRIGGIVSE